MFMLASLKLFRGHNYFSSHDNCSCEKVFSRKPDNFQNWVGWSFTDENVDPTLKDEDAMINVFSVKYDSLSEVEGSMETFFKPTRSEW